MNKKELCNNSLSIAYYSGFNGLEIKSTIQENTKEIYAVSNAWIGQKRYHKLKIYVNKKGRYIRLCGQTCYLHDFIKM